MNALKAHWTISWGVVPGHHEGQVRLSYTSQDHDDDQAEEWKPGQLSKFEKLKAEANYVALAMSDPSRNNWVTCEFVWI